MVFATSDLLVFLFFANDKNRDFLLLFGMNKRNLKCEPADDSLYWMRGVCFCGGG